MRILIAALIGLTTLAACEGTPDANSLFVNFGENNTFTGQAGANWSEAELRANSGRKVCGDALKLTSMAFARGPDGVAKFSGQCAVK